MSEPSRVLASTDGPFIKLHIDGELHLAALAGEIVSVQSWFDKTEGMGKVDIGAAEWSVTLNYATRDLWLSVLGALDGAIPGQRR